LTHLQNVEQPKAQFIVASAAAAAAAAAAEE
jgi:hypothetical protein